MALKEIEIERLSEEEKNTRLNGILNSHPLGMALILVMSKGEVDYLSPPESQIRSHKLTVDVADRVLRKYKGELEFEKCEDLRSLDRMLFDKTLELVRPFVPEGQFDIIKYNCSNGEEREFFREKVRETALKVISVPEAEDGGNEHAALHYFHGSGTDIWIKDIDARNDEYFGFTCLNGDWEMAEYGYGSLSELMRIPGMELDLHFDGRKKTLEEIIDENKEAYYGQNSGFGRGHDRDEGDEGEIRHEGEGTEGDREGEALVSGGEVPEDKTPLQTVPDGQLAGGRGHSEPISSGSGGGQAGVSGDSGEGHDSQSDAGEDDVHLGGEIPSPPEDNDGSGGGRDGDVADTDGGRGIPDNDSDGSGGRRRDDILQAYGPDRIREIARDRGEHLTKSDIRRIRASCAEILEKGEGEITAEDKEVLSSYEGAGGLGEESANGAHEILSEYYTPERVIDFAWAVVDRYSAEGYIREIKEVLEPSCGTGRFAKGRSEHFNMFEIDPVSSRIARILYPEADIRHEPFQKQYVVDGTYMLKPEFQAKDGISSVRNIDLVIGNPPYGAYGGRYKGIGEGKECLSYPEYFIKRGIDNLQNGGMLCFVIPAGFLSSNGASAAKEYIAEFAELVNAYRLPNSTFPTTSIATDVVFFRANRAKDGGETEKRLSDITDDNFFKSNPENIFGAMSRGSYKNMITVENGNWKDSRTTEDYMQRALLSLYGKEADEGILFPCGKNGLNFTDEERERQKEENSKRQTEEHSRQIALNARKKTKKKAIELGKVAKADPMSDVDFNEKYGKQYSRQLKEIWKRIRYDGSFSEDGLSEEAKELLKTSGDFILFDEKERTYFPKTLFASGNIYRKLDDLEKRLKEGRISREIYDGCKAALERARPEPIPFDKLIIKPNSTVSSEFLVTRNLLERNYGTEELTERKDEINLKNDFLFWAGGADRFALAYEFKADGRLDESYSRVVRSDYGENISWRDIVDYLNGVPVREKTVSPSERERIGEDEYKRRKEAYEQEASLKRAERMESANRLFERYLNDREWFREDDRLALTEYYNRIHNAVASPDFTKIPIFLDGMNRFKGGREFTLHDAQLRGINFLTQKGKGLLAYEVGVGKTSAGICATVLQIQSGRAKRPLVIVPKAVYPKWVKDIHEHFPEIRINALGNMNEDLLEPYRNPDDFRKLDIEEGSITVITYQGLTNYITFDDKTLEDLKEEYGYIYGEGSGSRRTDALTDERIAEYIATINGRKDDKCVFFDLCGFDHITVDEAHNFKNLVSTPSAGSGKRQSNDYKDIKGSKPSIRARNLFAVTQYVQKHNNDRNVFFLTATPFTNSPLEVYSMLTYLYRKEMIDGHIYNIRDFIEEFIRVKRELVIDKEGKIKYSMVVKNWTNLKALQGLLQDSMDKVGAEDANIRRPERMVEKILVEPTALQKEIFEAEAVRMRNAGRNTGEILQAINNKRIATLSPVLLNANREYDGGIAIPEAERLVEASPKLRITCETIAMSWKARKDCGQVLYMTFGKEHFELLKSIMAKDYGIDKGAIEIISGATSEEKRERIQERFNDPKDPVKILIGSSAITEGIDLNGNSTTLYNLNLGWNPTELTQSEGRIWRQGNRQGIVHIVYVLENDTSDPFILQKLDEKKTRIDEIWNYSSSANEIDVSDINPLETKFDLIKDPEAIVDIKIDDMTAEIKAKASILENNIIRLEGMKNDLYYTNQKIAASARPARWDSNKQSKLYEKLEREYGLAYDRCNEEGFREKAEELKRTMDGYQAEIEAVLSRRSEMVALEKENIEKREREKFESSEYYNTSDAVFERISSNLKPAERTQRGQGEDIALEKEENENRANSKINLRDDEAVDAIFKDALQKQIDGKLEKDYVYQLGYPSELLKKYGMPDLPIELKASRLEMKSNMERHPYNLDEIKELHSLLSEPLAIFKYGDKEKAQNLILGLQKENKNFISGIALNPLVNGKRLEVNSIRTLYPKDNAEWLHWIEQDKALYLDKEKIQALIDQQRMTFADVEYLNLDSIIIILKNFDNSKNAVNNRVIEKKEKEVFTQNAVAMKAMNIELDENNEGVFETVGKDALEKQKNQIKKKGPVGTMSLFDFLDESEDESEKRKEEIEIKQKEQKKENKAAIQALKTQKEDKALAENWRMAFGETEGDTVSNIIKGYKETKPESLYGKRVESSSDMAELLRALRNPNIITHKVISLDKDDRILDIRVVGIGESDKGCLANPSFALMNLSSKARKIYVSHNRPDGDVEMRDSDLLFSKQVEEIAREKGIEFKDNIITNGTRFYLYSARETRKYHKCDKEIWENMDASLLGYKIDGARDIEVLSSALRQSSPGMKHLIYLTGDDRVCGAHKYHSLEDLKAGLLKTKEIGASKVCCDSPDWKHAMEFASAFGVRTGIVMDGYGNVVDAGSAGIAGEPAVRKDIAIGTACDVDPDSGAFAVRFFSGGLAAPAKIPCRCQGFSRRIKDGSSVLVRGTWESDGNGGRRLAADDPDCIESDLFGEKGFGETVRFAGKVEKAKVTASEEADTDDWSIVLRNDSERINARTCGNERLSAEIRKALACGKSAFLVGTKRPIVREDGRTLGFVLLESISFAKSESYLKDKASGRHAAKEEDDHDIA